MNMITLMTNEGFVDINNNNNDDNNDCSTTAAAEYEDNKLNDKFRVY